MDAQYIERIMMLASCTEEEARLALSKTGNVVDAADSILATPITRGAPKKKKISEEQESFKQIRETMESIDKNIESEFTKSNQSDSSSQALKRTHVRDQEELMLRSDYTQSSQIPVQE